MLLAVRISSYGCTWEVFRSLEKLELISALALNNSYGPFVLSKFHANNPQLDTRTHPKPGHEPIL